MLSIIKILQRIDHNVYIIIPSSVSTQGLFIYVVCDPFIGCLLGLLFQSYIYEILIIQVPIYYIPPLKTVSLNIFFLDLFLRFRVFMLSILILESSTQLSSNLC